MKFKQVILLLFIILSYTPSFSEETVDYSVVSDEFLQNQEEEVLPSSFQPVVLNESEVVFKKAKKYISKIDPATNGYFPGGRGTNMLVIYTPQYGFHTGTNEFGTEAIVEGNVVTSLSGADSVIPKDGIVISGHGTAKNWISQNVAIGSKVYVDKFSNTITVYTTSESYTYEAESKIKEAISIIDYYKDKMPLYNSELPSNHIRAAQNYLVLANNNKNNPEILKQYTKEAINSASQAIKTSLPYLDKELKGVWLRPTEVSEEQIASTLDKIKDSGFNSVFLETYYHGKTIYPSDVMNKYGFTVQNENFVGFDPLSVWISEAHKRNIQVHTWFQSFYVGNTPPSYDASSILSVHPEWGNKTKQYALSYGPTRSSSEHNGYFLDPANEDVQVFLEELVTEIVTKYKPDGINLDYIRYPQSNPRNELAAWGFSEYARNEFQGQYGVDPYELTLSDASWYDWNAYRRNKITQFVQRIGQIGRDNKVYISAVIFPDIASALATKQQDWRTWSFQNYIDGFTPLFLTYDSKMLVSMMNDVMRVKAPETELYAGIFVTFMGGNSEDLIRQIFESRKLNSNGIILFDYAHTTPVYTTTLMASAFNSENIATTKTKIAQKKNQKKEIKKYQQEDKSKKKTIITTNSKGSWVFSK